MPYIKQEVRRKLDSLEVSPRNAGELNYFIHTFLEKYVEVRGESYQTYNDIMGALTGIQQELYRRKIAPYEDKKKEENGDIKFYQEVE